MHLACRLQESRKEVNKDNEGDEKVPGYDDRQSPGLMDSA